MIHRTLALIALLAVAAGVVFGASDSTLGTPVAGLPRPVFTLDADDAAIAALDDGAHNLTGKTGIVYRCTVNSQVVYVMVRVQRASNGLFVDLALSETGTALETRSAALSLASVTSSAHPAPTEDACDDALATAVSGGT